MALHTDHARRTPSSLRAAADRRVQRPGGRGEQPLFNSHMFDGSSLSLEDNLAYSAPLLEESAGWASCSRSSAASSAARRTASAARATTSDLYTTPEDLLRVAEVLGTGERGRYILAATFGNVHGVYKPGHVQLRPEVLGEGQEALARPTRARASSTSSTARAARRPRRSRPRSRHGVVKINLDTDVQYVFTRRSPTTSSPTTTASCASTASWAARPTSTRSWGRKAEAGIAARIAHACELSGRRAAASSA